jgi:hypothetical protein
LIASLGFKVAARLGVAQRAGAPCLWFQLLGPLLVGGCRPSGLFAGSFH